MKKLLIIEDDLELALSIRKYFADKGMEAMVVTDGEKGYRHAIKNLFEVVIVDYGLPAMNGDDIVRKLREAQVDTPIIMLTGRRDAQYISHSLLNGADDYLTKPFSSLELEARVCRFLTRPPVSRRDSIKLDSFEFDTKAGLLKYYDTTATLTKRESRLLNYLFMNKNYTVSRERLLNNVWGDKSDLKVNTVDCYISNIRRKLGLKKKSEFIKTSHGYGYTLVV